MPQFTSMVVVVTFYGSFIKICSKTNIKTGLRESEV